MSRLLCATLLLLAAAPSTALAEPPSICRPVELMASVAPVKISRTWLIPRWVMVGILARETRSRLSASNELEYVDKRRGACGERGPTQIMRGTFEQYALPGERFWMLESDAPLALDVTERILLDHRRVLGSWEQAVRAYNAGRNGRRGRVAGEYWEDVKRLSGRKP